LHRRTKLEVLFVPQEPKQKPDEEESDYHGTDFSLIEPQTEALLVRGNIYTVMVGHVVLQVLSWHLQPLQNEGKIHFSVSPGPWDKLTTQIWPSKKKSVTWPPPMSLSTVFGVNHYAYFRRRFQSEKGHRLITPKAKGRAAS
jgi:hypothetical protein